MQTIPLKDLKENLSSIGKRVARGERIIVTKHNKPFIQLALYEDDPSVIVGEHFGKRSLKPAFDKRTILPVLQYLQEDREDRF